MTHALIIGGGIAGAATALALHKAGISATIHEAYPTGADDIGAFLMIMHNGFDALRAIDAQQPVVAESFGTTRVEYLNSDGATIAGRPIGDKLTDANGPRTLKRADLYRALQDEWTRRGGVIEHGKRLTGASTAADGTVTARFADGDTATGDLLIGADGIHSATRAVIDPAAPRPRYTGKNLVYGYVVDPSLPAAPDTFRMIHGRSTGFGYTTSPAGETFWTTTIPGPELTASSARDWRHMALELFARDADDTAARIIEATGEGVMVSGTYDVPSVPRWRRGSAVLVGDAAHAASPVAAQGASMALEDSVVLAKCLRDRPDPASAFRAYEKLRRARVERLVSFSTEQADRARADTTDQGIERRARPDVRAWLYAHHIDWDEPVGSSQ